MSPAALVVIGAGLAGLRAVEAARRTGFDGTITLIGAEPHPPYDRPPLSKGFLDVGARPPYLRSQASLRADLGVDVRLGQPATALCPRERVVVLGSEEFEYSGLVIATGAAPRALPGVPPLAGVHTLRTIEDARALRQAFQPGSRVVVIGAGFIGTEIAWAARRRGSDVAVVEAAPVPMLRAVGPEMGAVLAGVLTRSGIPLRCGVAVSALGGIDRVQAVRLSDGAQLPADVVVVGIGAAPATSWLDGSGLRLDDGVVCDQTLCAGPNGVYAAGDAARWFNPLFGQTMRLEHWTAAAEQGAVAARNAIDPSRAAPCLTVPYAWSDWGTDRVQFVGLPGADEVRIVSGSPDAGEFLALYRRGDRVTGALGLNQPLPVARLRSLLAQRSSWQLAVESSTASVAVSARAAAP